MPKAAGEKVIAQNRQAFHEYHIEEKLEAGIELMGSEVKSCRLGKVQLGDSYASIERGEMWLYKVHISEYAQGGPFFNHPPVRKRRLLLHRREIKALVTKTEQRGYTLIPIRVYLKNGRIKVELALARGKTKGDKREATKERETKTQIQRAVRRSRDYDDD